MVRYLKLIALATITLLALPMVGCTEGTPTPYTSFVANDGSVILGQPRLGKDGCWWFSVEAKPEMVHSAQYVGDFDTSISGDTIYITALMYPVSRYHEPKVARVAIVCGLPDGVFNVMYQDPDGTGHEIGHIQIDRSAELMFE